jgi:hypothetical protein
MATGWYLAGKEVLVGGFFALFVEVNPLIELMGSASCITERSHMGKLVNNLERAIVIYTSRKRVMVSILILTLINLVLLFFIMQTYFRLAREFSTPFTSFFFWGDLIAMLLWLIVLIMFGGSLIFNMHRLVSREAALRVDEQGIVIRDYFPLGRIVLPWTNIAALYTRGQAEYLFVRVKSLDDFLVSYPPVPRFVFRLLLWNRRLRETPISAPAVFLSMPVPQVLRQVRDRFGDELDRYQVDVQV